MRSYARAWFLVAVTLGACGAAEALLAVPGLTVWTAALATAAVVALSHLSFVARRDAAARPGWSTARAAGLGGVTAMATTGLVALLGGGAALVVAIVVCVHPRVLGGAVGQVRRLVLPARPAATATAGRPAAVVPGAVPATGSTRPRDWASKVIPSLPPEQPWPTVAEMSRLSLAELCWGWRASFTALERADARIEHRRWSALVAVRQRYLDEMAHRDPAGFARWIHAGARPASDPTRYLLVPPGRDT